MGREALHGPHTDLFFWKPTGIDHKGIRRTIATLCLFVMACENNLRRQGKETSQRKRQIKAAKPATGMRAGEEIQKRPFLLSSVVKKWGKNVHDSLNIALPRSKISSSNYPSLIYLIRLTLPFSSSWVSPEGYHGQWYQNSQKGKGEPGWMHSPILVPL